MTVAMTMNAPRNLEVLYLIPWLAFPRHLFQTYGSEVVPRQTPDSRLGLGHMEMSLTGAPITAALSEVCICCCDIPVLSLIDEYTDGQVRPS